MSTVKVRYVGKKEAKNDNVAGTGTVWRGTDDIQEVPLAAWAKMSMHPDIWERVAEQAPAAKTAAPATPALASAPPPAPTPTPQPAAKTAGKQAPAAKTAAQGKAD